jgi:hypothetical protein
VKDDEGCPNCRYHMLCRDCIVELSPTWFWWNDVPFQFRLSTKWLRDNHRDGEWLRQELSHYRLSLKPQRCEVATIWNAPRRYWWPCNRPGAEQRDGHWACKTHIKSFGLGKRISGVPLIYQRPGLA